MDLPTELRLMIAEYALTSDEPLHWIWLEHGPIEDHGRCHGTFEGLERLTSLSRVSRQLHNETARLVWKSNNFLFDETKFGGVWSEEPYHAFDTDVNALSYVHEFFLRVAGSDIAGLLRSITLTLSFYDYQHDFKSIQKLAEVTPNARLKICHRNLELVHTGHLSSERVEALIHDYMSTLRDIQAALASYSTTAERKWKVYPMGGHRDLLRKHLQGADLAKALAWEANGLWGHAALWAKRIDMFSSRIIAQQASRQSVYLL